MTPPRIVGLAVVAGAGFGLLFVFLDRTSEASGFWPLLIGQLTTLPIVVSPSWSRASASGQSAVPASSPQPPEHSP